MWSFIKFVILPIALIEVTILISFLKKKSCDVLVYGPKVPSDGDEFSKCSLTETGEIPYHVTIELRENYLCSGTFIGTRYVLVPANCVWNTVRRGTYKEYMKVFIGKRTLVGGTPYKVEKITCHPSYVPRKKHTDDIAVVQLKGYVNQTFDVKPIPLPNEGAISSEGLELLVSGYTVYATTARNWYLDQRKFSMHVVSKKMCQKYFTANNWNISGKFCAVPAPGYKHCQSDGGSPATVNKQYIIGVYLGYMDCSRRQPEIFVDVSSYLDFIRSAMA